jgi:hypothetical protein
MSFIATPLILVNIYCTKFYPNLTNNIEKICKFFLHFKEIVAFTELILTELIIIV